MINSTPQPNPSNPKIYVDQDDSASRQLVFQSYRDQIHSQMKSLGNL